MVVYVTERFVGTRPFATAQFFPYASAYVFREADDIIGGASPFNAHEQPGIFGKELSGRGANGNDNAILQKPARPPLVNRITIQAVNVPTQNAIRFTALNAVKHPIENGPAGKLRALTFFEHLANEKVLAFCKLAKLVDLRWQAHDLMRRVVSGFADIEEIFD